MFRRFVLPVIFCLFACPPALSAQSVQPVIQEYKGKASGQILLTNNTLNPMVITLEPRSFSIDSDGRGAFRPLDAGIHVELSTQSIRLEPQQTYHVFYRASADSYPAWFTVYASFSSMKHGPSLDVRIMLPHTVYMYQKQNVEEHSIQVTEAAYNPTTHAVECSIKSATTGLIRVLNTQATSGHESVEGSGFPLLPQNERHIEIPWDKSDTPQEITLHFEHFTMKHPVQIRGQ